MDRLGPGLLGGLDDLRDVQIALGRNRRADQEGLVGLAHMRSVPIDLGVDGDGADPHLLQGPGDADGDLAAVGYQDLLEHGGGSLLLDERVGLLWYRRFRDIPIAPRGPIGCAVVLIELQSHSTVSDGQLAPAEVVEKAAEAGVTTLALTDHDAIAGVAEAAEAAREARGRAGAGDRDVVRARVRRRPAHLRLLGRPGEDRAGLRAGAARTGCAGRRDRREAATRGLRPAPRGRGPRGGRRALDRPSAHRPGGGRERRPRPLLRGVPGAGRQGLRAAPLADRRAGDRADPRRRRRRRHRPPLLGHLRRRTRSTT